MAVPRMIARAGSFAFSTVPDHIDGVLGLQNAGGVIAEATGEGEPAVESALHSSMATQRIAAAATAAEAVAADGGSPSNLWQSWSFHNMRKFGGILSYMTSKWALGCFMLVGLCIRRTNAWLICAGNCAQ